MVGNYETHIPRSASHVGMVTILSEVDRVIGPVKPSRGSYHLPDISQGFETNSLELWLPSSSSQTTNITKRHSECGPFMWTIHMSLYSTDACRRNALHRYLLERICIPFLFFRLIVGGRCTLRMWPRYWLTIRVGHDGSSCQIYGHGPSLLGIGRPRT